MAETALVSFGDGRNVDRYAFGSHGEQVRSTFTRRESSDSLTHATVVDGEAEVYRPSAAPPETAKQAIQRMIGAPRRDSVRVDVRDLAGAAVVCQIADLGGNDVVIELPFGLFPPSPQGREPFIGASYQLKMEDCEGFRRPVLTWFEGGACEARDLKERISAKVEAFKLRAEQRA
ncbi:hypothetical protein FJP65_07105 [Stenotrophomonas maltophilia]|nr:hypothetical protein FJP65_07105 [Stenotrophomonas maltophilia]